MKRDQPEGQKKIQQSVDRSDTKPKDGPIGPCEKKRKSRSEPGIEKLFFHFLFLSVRGSLGRTLRRGRGGSFPSPPLHLLIFPRRLFELARRRWRWRTRAKRGRGRRVFLRGREEFQHRGNRPTKELFFLPSPFSRFWRPPLPIHPFG